MSEQYEDSAKQMTDSIKQKGKKMLNSGANLAKSKTKRKVGKAAAKLVKRAIAIVVKGFIALIAPLLPILVPLLIGLVLSMILMHLTFEYEYEIRTEEQNYQTENPTFDNVAVSSGNGSKKVTEITGENLLVRAFYINYSNQSYFKYFNNKQIRAGNDFTVKGVKGLDESGEKIYEDVPVADKYGKETAFYLSDTFLWTLDTILHNREFHYPEAFLRPLYMDLETFEVKDLIKDDVIQVSSKEYNESGERTTTDVPGAWDYGVAPVLNYQEFEEDSEYRYSATQKQIAVDTDGDGLADSIEWSNLSEEDASFEDYQKRINGYPQTVFMIDKVATFLGTVKNQIDFQWLNSKRNAPTEDTVYTQETLYEKYYEEEKVNVRDAQGRIRVVVHGNINGAPKTISTHEGGFKKTSKNIYIINNSIYKFDKAPGIAYPTETRTVEKIREKSVDLMVRFEGERWDLTPYYVGSPDFSGFKGQKYLRDYVSIYQTYVPSEVMSDFDLKSRTQGNEEELQQLVKEYEITASSGESYADVEVKEGSVESLQNAYNNQFKDAFEKYGTIYGVDPALLKAMAAQESGGNHDKYTSLDRCSKAGCGLMQIERPGKTVQKATAFNFSTGQQEEVTVCYPGQSNNPTSGCLDVLDIDNNIRVGAMQFAQRLQRFDYNFYVALQSYNYGEGGVRRVLRIYQEREGRSIEQTIQDYKDTGWLKYRNEVHYNPSLLGSTYASYKTYGDPIYIENVLRYYPTNQDIKIKTPAGDEITISPDMAGGIDVNIADSSRKGDYKGVKGFFKNIWDKLSNSFDRFFEYEENFKNPDKIENIHTPELTTLEVDLLMSTIFAMDEGVRTSEYENVTDEMWQEKFALIFSNPYDVEWALNTSSNFMTDPYFGGQASTPVEKNIMKVLKPFGIVNDSQHTGIDLFAPIGTIIHSIFEGTVTEIIEGEGHEGNTIVVDHGGGMEGRYGNIDTSTIKVSVGDKVKKNTQLALVMEAPNNSEQYFHFTLKKDGVPVNPIYAFSSGNYGGQSNYTPQASSSGWVIPVDEGRVTCEYGCYRYSSGAPHEAIDIGRYQSFRLPQIIASNDGVVFKKGFDSDGFGNYIMMTHQINGQTYTTVYAHMSSIAVEEGQQLKAGDMIGVMGTTGNSTGIHLHFAIYEGYYNFPHAVNPRIYLTNIPPEGQVFSFRE